MENNYDDDSKMMRRMIEREYPEVFDKEQIKKNLSVEI